MALKMAAMGVTVVAASCNDSANTYKSSCDQCLCGYNPIYPGSSPYVLSVGATMVSLTMKLTNPT